MYDKGVDTVSISVIFGPKKSRPGRRASGSRAGCILIPDPGCDDVLKSLDLLV
jgi:hypothetical protein